MGSQCKVFNLDRDVKTPLQLKFLIWVKRQKLSYTFIMNGTNKSRAIIIFQV